VAVTMSWLKQSGEEGHKGGVGEGVIVRER
jgi:hypothetical protein